MRQNPSPAPRCRARITAIVTSVIALLLCAGPAPAAPSATPIVDWRDPAAVTRQSSVILRVDPSVDPGAPKATVVAPALASGSSASASFRVSWSAEPALPSAGYDAWRVEYREPGIDYWFVWQAATTGASAVFPGEAGHAYEFRAAVARAADPSVIGEWSAVARAAAPADDVAFAVTRTWKRTALSGAYCGKVRTATTKGATATYRFKGTKVALIAPRGRAYGKVAAYVRSATASGRWTAYKLVKTIDLYAKSARNRVATSIGSYEASTERQVKFVVTGTKNLRSTSTKVSLDGLAVYGAPRAYSFHWVDIAPADPSVVITEQLRLTASIPGCVDQRVEWAVHREDYLGEWHTDGAGSISAAGVYTAPTVPTNDAHRESHCAYIVTAVGAANPGKLYGSARITVTLGPRPVIDSVSPLTAPVGASVSIAGRNFTDHGGVPRVLFQGVDAQVSSYTGTLISATVPGGWQTWSTSLQACVSVETWGQSSNTDQSVTVTGISPMPPWLDAGGINYSSTDDDNASVGDELRLSGKGFAPAASDNLVRFGGGVVAAASRYQADPYSETAGYVWVTVPPGAETGALATQRLDGDGSWRTGGPALEVKPATEVTCGLHASFKGYATGPRMARNGSWGCEDWLLQGANFTKLRIADYSTTTAGVFWLDMRRNGVTCSRIMRAVSDTLAVPHRNWGEQIMMPDAIFADAQPGDTVELRIRGNELTNRYERTSDWFTVPLGDSPVLGAVHGLSCDYPWTYWAPPGTTFAQGSWLVLSRNELAATQVLTAPGLWQGALPLGIDGIAKKVVRLDTLGTYTVTNETTGESVTFSVGEIGGFGTWSYGCDGQPDLHVNGLLMRFAGGEIDVPAGALSAGDLGPYSYFTLGMTHESSGAVPWDPALTDGGRRFSLTITPEPTMLLKPIRITLPYDPAGRTTTPFLGMWDASAGLYFDYGSTPDQIDTANHTVTYVLPAGDYSSPAAKESSAVTQAAADGEQAAHAAAAPAGLVAAPAGSALPALPFNQLFKGVGVVSSQVATSGEGYVWHPDAQPAWGVRVDAITDPASSSYVPPEKAQEVLSVAAATWTNLAAKGWRVPEGMITLTVRDYGDPGAYQGATTKGVFGQPWVYINSRLAMGAKLDTAVAHEMGHVFQRQLTTNITTKWIDEAVAEWVAWDTLGTGSDLRASFEAGCDFPAVTFPSGFWAGYSTEQAYGAGALAIWLADTYGAASLLSIYDNLAYHPENWYDSSATFLAATGQTLPDLVSRFASDFWLQAYDPVKAYTWSSALLGQIASYDGATVTQSLPVNASLGIAMGPTSGFRATLTGQPMVARAPGLPVGARIDVYRDTTVAAEPPAAPVKIGTLTSDAPVLDLGAFGASVGCYRLVAVSPASAAVPLNVTVEPVRITAILPQSVAKAGGAGVTLNGAGFGDVAGTVMVGPALVTGAAITSWSDTRVVFTMPNMGETTGAQSVTVRPTVGGTSNAVTLTVY